MELYLYDFSEFDQADIGQLGLYNYPHLEKYWSEPHRHPFFIRVDEHLAGFVLVTRYNIIGVGYDYWVMAEFFVMRKYRRHGIGQTVAHQIFDRFPGPWQVAQLQENTSAIAFWRKVIDRYTAGKYKEYILQDGRWHGPIQVFYSPPDSGPAEEPQWFTP